MLLYFILGVLLISIGLPLLQAFASIISSWAQYMVYFFAFKIYKLKQIMGIQDQEDDKETKIIGFTEAIGTEVQNQEFYQEE